MPLTGLWHVRAQPATQEALQRLSTETLVSVLQSDNLRVPSELHVFQSVVAWLEADPCRAAAAAEVCLNPKNLNHPLSCTCRSVINAVVFLVAPELQPPNPCAASRALC
jgi:hypothetical protein